MSKGEWYSIDRSAEIDSPALVIYPDRVRNNIRILKTFVSDIRQLRPHVKTNKCAEVIRLMREAGINKFKCATIAEAELLALEATPDVLLAYQPVGPKAERFCRLQQHFPETSFSCLVDNEKSLIELSGWAGKFNQRIRIFIDINVGMNRTGITPDKAFSLFQKATGTNGIEFIGLHAYDGHIRDKDLETRTKKCKAAFSDIEQLRTEIEKSSAKATVVVAGGTPTFPIHAKNTTVECSPGTFIFWDVGYQQMLPDQPFEFAALVLTRIISKPNAETLCVDLGHKSIASENPIASRVYFLNGGDLTPVGHSEEHLVLKAPKGHGYQIGDVLYGVPQHICPTVALYDEARVCQDHTWRETWPIAARKRKITI